MNGINVMELCYKFNLMSSIRRWYYFSRYFWHWHLVCQLQLFVKIVMNECIIYMYVHVWRFFVDFVIWNVKKTNFYVKNFTWQSWNREGLCGTLNVMLQGYLWTLGKFPSWFFLTLQKAFIHYFDLHIYILGNMWLVSVIHTQSFDPLRSFQIPLLKLY